MSTTMQWSVSADGGYMYNDELSDVLRTAMQPLAKMRQFCEPDPGAMEKGLHRGQSYFWNVYGDVAQQGRRLSELQQMPETNFAITQNSLTIHEFGQSVPYTGLLAALAKHDVLAIITKGLKNDARKALDIEVYNQFDTCLLRVAPTSGTSTTAVTLTTNGATATTNNVAMGTGHIRATNDIMRERNIPGFVEDDYVSIGHPTTFRPVYSELETIHQYTREGQGMVYQGERGRYDGTRFVEQNFIPKGGANDSTTFDPYTATADAWDNGKSSWAFIMGGDTVQEAICIPEEIRAIH